MRVRVPRAFGAMRVVRTRSNPDREPSFSDAVVVHETDDAVWWEAAIRIENPVHGYRFLMESDDGATGGSPRRGCRTPRPATSTTSAW